MATSYTYSIQNNFINHKVDITILQKEILASTNITKELEYIHTNVDLDNCDIIFKTPLTVGEKSILDYIISIHTALLSGGEESTLIGNVINDINISFGDDMNDYYVKFSNSSYQISSQFIFQGTNNLKVPTGIKAIIKGSGGLRLFNKTNCQVVFEWNNINYIHDFNIFSQATNINWPERESILEIQGKKGWDHLYLSNFLSCFNNNVIDNIPS